jgi:hypothetical protein
VANSKNVICYNKSDLQKLLDEKRAAKAANAKAWAAKHYRLPPSEVLWYHGGICYNRIVVVSKASADKVAKAVEGETVNGGWYDGMRLGGITKVEGGYEVIC